jgi:hypothetical protein
LIVDQPAVHHPDHGGLGLVDDQMAGYAVALGDIAITVGPPGGDPMTLARPLDFAATESLAEDGALVFGDGPLDLEQELVVWVGGDGPLDELDGTAVLAELLQQERLMDIAAGQAVGAVDGDDIELARGRGVPQAIQAGAVQPRARVARVGEDVLGAEVMGLAAGPGLKGRELALDRLILVLSPGRDSGIDRYSHENVSYWVWLMGHGTTAGREGSG